MTDDPTTPQEPIEDDIWGFLAESGLDIPVPIPSRKHPKGKRYRIASPDAETGLRLTGLAEIARKSKAGLEVKDSDIAKLNMNDDEERDFAVQVMGPTYHEMISDGVAWDTIQKVMQYAYIHFSMGADVAEKAAREGLFQGGKVRIPANRAERRATGKKKTPTTRATR